MNVLNLKVSLDSYGTCFLASKFKDKLSKIFAESQYYSSLKVSGTGNGLRILPNVVIALDCFLSNERERIFNGATDINIRFVGNNSLLLEAKNCDDTLYVLLDLGKSRVSACCKQGEALFSVSDDAELSALCDVLVLYMYFELACNNGDSNSSGMLEILSLLVQIKSLCNDSNLSEAELENELTILTVRIGSNIKCSVEYGELSFLKNPIRKMSGANLRLLTVKDSANDINKEDVVSLFGMYSYHKNCERVYTENEKKMLKTLDSSYIVPSFVNDVCQNFCYSTDEVNPIRTALFYGKPGTGKTLGAVAMSILLGLPYSYTTCNEDTDSFDLFGQIIPVDGNVLDKSLELPSVSDVFNDTVSSYYKITGIDNPNITVREVIEALQDKQQMLLENGNGFKYVESELVRAIKYGWFHEIQECTMVRKSGIFTGLNSILESGNDKYLMLPNGERIKKHPDFTCVFTINRDLNGNKSIQQSVLSRLSIVCNTDNLTVQDLFNRAKAQTGFSDDEMLNIMVRTILDISEHLESISVVDGSVGQRELINWITAVKIRAKVDECDITRELVRNEGIKTVVNKSSQTVEGIEEAKIVYGKYFALV